MPYSLPYRPRLEVRVNGQPVVALRASVAVGTRAPIATATVSFADSDVVAPGDTIEVRGGLGEVVTLFVGEVPEDGVAYWPNRIEAQAQGPLAKATFPLGVDPIDDAELEDPITGEPLPAVAFAGLTDGAIVKQLLDLCGVDYEASGIAEAGVTLGVVHPVTLGRKESPLQLIQSIDEAYGYRTYDGPDGLVRRVVNSGLPPTATIVLQEGQNIGASARRSQSLRDVRNRANVTGAEDDGITIRATAQEDSRASPRTGKPYIPTPPQYAAYTFSSPLLETYDNCLAHATRAVGALNRVQESCSLSLIRGNPRVQPGQGIAVVSPKLGYDISFTFRAAEVRHELNAQSFHTSLQLEGGYEAEGVDANVHPRAAFTITVFKEYLDGVAIWVVMADASSSTDPDGAYVVPEVPATSTTPGAPEQTFNGIVRYTWTSTLGSSPSLSPATVSEVGGMRATWVCTDDPTGKSITLVVMDAQGATATVTQTIRDTPRTPFLVRDIWAAVDSETLYSSDGERTWTHIAVPGKALAPQAADTFQIVIGVDGSVNRVLVDGTHTVPPTAPTDATCAFIRWTYPEATVSGLRCWVGTASGGIWFSGDHGVTWEQKATLDGHPWVTHIEESPFAENNLAATAANKMWGSFNGTTWAVVYAHPNALLQATSYASGFSHAFVGFAGTPGGPSEASRIFERANQIKGDWNKSSAGVALPTGTYKVQASYLGYAGGSPASPAATIAVIANRVIQVASFVPLPAGVYGVAIYVSVAGGSTARFIGVTTGDSPFIIDHVDPTGVAAPVVGTALKAIAAPPAPTLTQLAPVTNPVDWPPDVRAITIGMYRPILMAVGDLPSGGDSVSWWADASGDFTFQRGAYNFATLGRAQHILRDGFIDGVVYGAAQYALFKSTSYLRDDCRKMLTLTGGQYGHMIAYGRIHPAPAVRGSLFYIGNAGTAFATSNKLIELGDSGWRVVSDVPSLIIAPDNAWGRERLWMSAAGTLFVWSWPTDAGFAGSWGTIYRSADRGATWSSIGTLATVMGEITQADDGTLFTYGNQGVDGGGFVTFGVMKSVDDGATWTEMSRLRFTNGGDDASNDYKHLGGLAVDPLDANHIVIHTRTGFRMSNDGGVTWLTPVNIGHNDDATNPVIAFRDGTFVLVCNDGFYRGTFGVNSVTRVATLDTFTVHGPLVTLDGQKAYAPSGTSAAFFQSSNAGLTWASASGDHAVAEDLATGDIYMGTTGYGGDPTLGTATGMIYRRVGGDPGSVTDLTQSQYDQLGALYRVRQAGMAHG